MTIFKVEGSKELETKRNMFMSCTVMILCLKYLLNMSIPLPVIATGLIQVLLVSFLYYQRSFALHKIFGVLVGW